MVIVTNRLTFTLISQTSPLSGTNLEHPWFFFCWSCCFSVYFCAFRFSGPTCGFWLHFVFFCFFFFCFFVFSHAYCCIRAVASNCGRVRSKRLRKPKQQRENTYWKFQEPLAGSGANCQVCPGVLFWCFQICFSC